jgi:uncharacterized protein YhbP (UPF0306 family)
MTAGLPPEVVAYLADHHVMTLASQGVDGPWASAVFYALDGGSLLFLSAPTTRHARNLELDDRCAVTIQDDIADWKAVKGIQLEGRVARLVGDEATAAHRRYAEKFPLVSPLAKIPPAIVEALARIRWYRLTPSRLYFIDNARGFGHRDEFPL